LGQKAQDVVPHIDRTNNDNRTFQESTHFRKANHGMLKQSLAGGLICAGGYASYTFWNSPLPSESQFNILNARLNSFLAMNCTLDSTSKTHLFLVNKAKKLYRLEAQKLKKFSAKQSEVKMKDFYLMTSSQLLEELTRLYAIEGDLDTTLRIGSESIRIWKSLSDEDVSMKQKMVFALLCKQYLWCSYAEHCTMKKQLLEEALKLLSEIEAEEKLEDTHFCYFGAGLMKSQRAKFYVENDDDSMSQEDAIRLAEDGLDILEKFQPEKPDIFRAIARITLGKLTEDKLKGRELVENGLKELLQTRGPFVEIMEATTYILLLDQILGDQKHVESLQQELLPYMESIFPEVSRVQLKVALNIHHIDEQKTSE
jgi:hypothetical protein